MNPGKITAPEILSTPECTARSGPLTKVIAYLSLCMLAAAFGSLLGPTWSRWWAIFGVFGLTSALGLDTLNRSRTRHQDRTRQRRLKQKAEQKLEEILIDMEAHSAIGAALRQLQPDSAAPAARIADRRVEPRLTLSKPATITPLVQDADDLRYRPGVAVAGSMCDISHGGFRLAHAQWLEPGFILLDSGFETGDPIRFIAEVLWCERQKDGYRSGGKILEVVSRRAGQEAEADDAAVWQPSMYDAGNHAGRSDGGPDRR